MTAEQTEFHTRYFVVALDREGQPHIIAHAPDRASAEVHRRDHSNGRETFIASRTDSEGVDHAEMHPRSWPVPPTRPA